MNKRLYNLTISDRNMQLRVMRLLTFPHRSPALSSHVNLIFVTPRCDFVDIIEDITLCEVFQTLFLCSVRYMGTVFQIRNQYFVVHLLI